jgi:hypothetical protein
MGKSLRQVDELISATLKHTYPAMFIHSGLVAAEVTKALSLVTVHAVALHEYVNLSETAAMRARPERFRVQDCPQHGHYYRDVNRVFIRLMFELPALRKNLTTESGSTWTSASMGRSRWTRLRRCTRADMTFGYMQCWHNWGCNRGPLGS